MPTYNDIGKGVQTKEDLQDEMKPNGVDLLLPFEDYNSGWTYLTRGSTVTINHNLGYLPRLITVLGNATAADNGFELVLSGTVAAEIKDVTSTSLTIKNTSSSTTTKYFKILLWR